MRGISIGIILCLLAGCGSSQEKKGIFESGRPRSSGSVEPGAPHGEVTLEFVVGEKDREGAYDLVATFPAGKYYPFFVAQVDVNGEAAPYFSVFNSHVWSRDGYANGKDDLVLHVMSDWSPGAGIRVDVKGITNNARPISLKATGSAPDEKKADASISFRMPDRSSPTYRVMLTVPGDQVPEGRISTIEVGTFECRDFDIRQGEREIHDRRTTSGEDLRITARYDWRPEEETEIRVQWEETVEGLEYPGRAGSPGWWDEAWDHYVGVSLEETAGIGRQGEPVHLCLAVFADRVTDPAKEVRVVTYAPGDPRSDDRGYLEVPSQVHNIHTWEDEAILSREETDEKTGEPILRYSPTTTFEVAFLADVPAYGTGAYLVFYGNPEAEAPVYETDLAVEGEGLGCSVENGFYKIGHAPNSGAMFTILVKQGLDVMLEHKLETNGAIQWNPDCYSPPHAWVHASDWEVPDHEIVVGPVFCMMRRWAPLPHLPDVLSSSTNIYYAGKPYVVVSETTEFREEAHVKAVRQAEVVFNHEVLHEFAWVDPLGAVQSFPVHGSRPHPEHAVRVPMDTDWYALLCRNKGVVFAGITLDVSVLNLTGGMGRLEGSFLYVANGPWVYVSRAFVYPFGSNNPSRMAHVPRGSMYHSRTAYLMTKLGTENEEWSSVTATHLRLTRPLEMRVFHDTDPRTPKGWVVPILTEPFDEGVEGQIGGEKEGDEDE